MVKIFIILMLFNTYVNAEEIIKGETEIEQLYNQLKYEENERQIRFGKDTISNLLNKNEFININNKKLITLIDSKKYSDENEKKSIVESNKEKNTRSTLVNKLKDESLKEEKDLNTTNIDKKTIKKSSMHDVTESNKKPIASTDTNRRSVVNHYYMPPSMRNDNVSDNFINNPLSLGSSGSTGSIGSNNNDVSQSYSNKNYKKYGIRRNTWVVGRLIRTVTSADSTYIEIELDDDIVGTRKVLPAGTILFGNKFFNSQTKRLESRFNEAIEPDGDELDNIDASLFDMNKVAGLTGLVTHDSEDSVEYSVYTGLSSAGDSILQGLGGGNIGVDGVLTGGKTMLDLQKEKIKKPQAFITVSSRQVLIRINKTF